MVPQETYARDLDLSGSLAGAGEIGGLLARYRHGTSSPYAINGVSFCHADGNGNVTYLANSTGGADAAYRYDPFGRWLAGTGPYAAANGMRFSSKPWIAHNSSNTDGLYYYGYRFYDPNTQRWLSRDPLGEPGHEILLNKRGKRSRTGLVVERGEPNLYGFVVNNPISYQDRDGREIFSYCPVCLAPISPFEKHQCKGPPPPDPCSKAIAAATAMFGNISNDSRAHCITSCEIAKACGKLACECLGNLKEARDLGMGGVEWVCSWVLPKKAEDWLHDHLQGGSVDDSAADFVANDWGLGIAKDGGDCVRECEARYGPEP